MNITMLLKDHNTKTTVSNDKVTRITLETIEPEQVEYLSRFVNAKLVKVSLEVEE